MENNIKYLQYPPTRDVVFVFGAGASHPDGVPLQRHILPMILNDEEIASSDIGKTVIQFIRDKPLLEEHLRITILNIFRKLNSNLINNFYKNN